MSNEVECVWPVAAQLGEGPMWSQDEHALWFVDIISKQLHRLDDSTNEHRSWSTPEFSAFIFPASNGKFICGLKNGLHEFDSATGSFTLRVRVDSEFKYNRLNDGYVDDRGRLWFGTMDINQTAASGSLYCYSDHQIKRCDARYVITNGPSISLDGTTLYHVDTQKLLVYAFDLDARGMLTNRRVLVRIEESSVFPDGPVVDANGNLWIAMFGGWGVRCYSPQGKMIDEIKLPVSNCTKVAFGGDDLRTMYITTAWVGLTEQQRKEQTLAGALFKVRVEVSGLPQNKFIV